MPKITHLTSAHTPFDTRIFVKQCRTLARRGFEVVLIAPHDRDEVVDGVRLRAVPRARTRLGRMATTTLRVARAAFSERSDLYHVHDPELLPVARLLTLAGRRVVFDMHENLPKAMLTKPWAPRLLRPALATACRVCERALLWNLPVVFAEQSYTNDYHWARQQRVVQNLPSVNDVPLAEPTSGSLTVGYVGGVSADRGSVTTLEAIGLLSQEGCDVGFECVGPATPEHRVELDRIVESHGLHRVRWHGRLVASAAWSIMSRCDVGVALLKPLPNFVGSYPTKMFEYMAMGLPVIVSDWPLYREVVEGAGCGLCVDPEDPRAVARAIRRLVEDPAEAARMGRRGRDAVLDRFNWDSEFGNLIDLYREVTKNDGFATADTNQTKVTRAA